MNRVLNGRSAERLMGFGLLATAGLALAGCDTGSGYNARANAPIPANTLALMEQKGTTKAAPVLIRAYKKEAELEVWKQGADGRYALLKTFPMCRWSGQLGPKLKEGDRQVPEGFYTITPAQMNPNSAYYLSFNVGYPNSYDRSHSYTGGNIMVHGVCSSAGCFSMTDEQIAEIYAITREAFAGGQRAIQMQSMPFHMTAENMAKYRLDPHIAFWKELKQGTDNFEVSQQEVQVGVCNRHYVFNAGVRGDASAPCPATPANSLTAALHEKQQMDDAKVAELIANGVKPVRTTYQDGGQNPEFASRSGDVSRPEALALGPNEIELDAKGKPLPAVLQVADNKARAGTPAATPLPVALATPAITTPASEAQSVGFASRWFGGGVTPKETPVGVDPTLAAQPANPQPANVPLPPRRQANASGSRPEASLAAGTLMASATIVDPGHLRSAAAGR